MLLYDESSLFFPFDSVFTSSSSFTSSLSGTEAYAHQR